MWKRSFVKSREKTLRNEYHLLGYLQRRRY